MQFSRQRVALLQYLYILYIDYLTGARAAIGPDGTCYPLVLFRLFPVGFVGIYRLDIDQLSLDLYLVTGIQAFQFPLQFLTIDN